MAHPPESELDDEISLFRRYAKSQDPRLREQLIARYIGLVSYLARRFHSGGDQLDDLIQVGFIGLIKAIDRFDPERGANFTGYAVPTIVGEIQHYFRDQEQAVSLPRRLHDLRRRAEQEIDRLTQQLDRTPSQQEIAAALNASVEDLAAARADTVISLESAQGSHALGAGDTELERSEDRAAIVQILRRLSPRERIVLYLRFYLGLPQTEVAKRLGISQMQVSRLQHRSLEKIKRSIEL